MSEKPKRVKTWMVVVGCLVVLAIIGSSIGKHEKTASEGQKGSAQAVGDTSQEGKTDQTKYDKKTIKFVQNSVIDDIINSVDGGDAILEKSKALQMLNISAAVDARRLAADYAANEVAADQKYKTKDGLLVSGVVDSISKDFTGSPYVVLRGNEMLQNVHAGFSRDSMNVLASLQRGKKATFVCRAGGYVALQVALKNCATPDAYGNDQKVRKPIDKAVSDVLSGKKTSDKDMAGMIATGVWMSNLLPNDSTCFMNVSGDECKKQFTGIAKASKKKPEAIDSEIAAIEKDFLSNN